MPDSSFQICLGSTSQHGIGRLPEISDVSVFPRTRHSYNQQQEVAATGAEEADSDIGNAVLVCAHT